MIGLKRDATTNAGAGADAHWGKDALWCKGGKSFTKYVSSHSRHQLTAIYASLNTHFPWLQLFSGFAQESVDDKIKKVLKVFRGGRSSACRTDTENWRTRSGSPRRRGGEILKSQNDLLPE